MGDEQHLSGLLLALIESANDKEPAVQDSVCSSLRTIGRLKPDCVLSSVHTYLARHSKLPSQHRGILLDVLDKICEEAIQKQSELGEKGDSAGPVIKKDMVALIVNMGTQEMTMAKDVQEHWQLPASNLLATLAQLDCTAVMDALLQKFQPGFTPHYYVVHSMGEIASRNAFAFIPFLSDVLSRTVPMLLTVKQDLLRYVFALSMKKYCESILEYISSLDRSPDPSVKKDMFSAQVGAAFDTFFGHWINSKDQKTRCVILEALGEMCHILAPEKLHEDIRKLIPQFLGMYKKQSDPASVSKGLCRILEAAVADEACPLEPYLEDVWLALFPQVGGEIDYSIPNSSKNQNEVLRCFHVTASKNSDKLCYYLLQKVQNGPPKAKIASLIVLRHLINSSGPYIDDKKPTIILGLKPVISDPSGKIKRQICQLSVAMADHGYLDGEGGRLIVEFLVKQLCCVEEESPAHKKAVADADGVSLTALRNHSSTALQVVTSTMQQAEQVLWPYLFEFLCVDHYTNAVADLCRSLALLAKRMNQEDRLKIDYSSSNDKLPGRHQILSRLLVLLSVPSPDRRGFYILQLLHELVTLFHVNLKPYWAKAVDDLRQSLEKSPEASCSEESSEKKENKWQIQLLTFLRKSIEAVHEEEWTCELTAAMAKQLPLYQEHVQEKSFLFRALGTLLTNVFHNKQFFVDHVTLMLVSVNPGCAVERSSCAQGVGLCAKTHVDIVLNKLENHAKLEFQKKSTGFLGFIKDSMPIKSEADVDAANLRATLMLCFGYVIYNCPSHCVTSKLDSVVLRFLTPYFENPKDPIVKESLLHAVQLFAAAVHPSRLNSDYAFEKRGQLLIYIKEYLKQETPEVLTSAVRIEAMKAGASLARLKPGLPESDVWSLCQTCALVVYPLNSAKEALDSNHGDGFATIESAVNALLDLYIEILSNSATPVNLGCLMKIVQPWLSSPDVLVRQRAIESAYVMLKAYYGNTDVEIGLATEFPHFGSLLGRMAPRLCDESLEIRLKTLECIHWLMAINVLHLGHGKDYRDSCVENILESRDLLEMQDLSAHLIVICNVSQMANQRLPPKQMQLYLTALFDIMLDPQTGVSCAAASLLRYTLIDRGPNLTAEADKIVSTMLAKLPDILPSVQTYAEALQSLHAFAEHHLNLVVANLLSQGLPFNSCICDCWHALARDGQMLSPILDQLCDAILAHPDRPPYESGESGSEFHYANIKTLVATAAIVEIVKGGEPESLILDVFPRLLSSLLLLSGAFAGALYPSTTQISTEMHRGKPLKLTQLAIKTLVHRTNATSNVMEEMDDQNRWDDLEDENHYVDSISALAWSLAVHHPEWLSPMVTQVGGLIGSEVPGHRVVTAALLADFLRAPQHQEDEMVENVLNLLMTALADQSLAVRKLAVRGMGNVAHCSQTILEQYVNSVLAAILSGLEDPADAKDEMSLEAMGALSKMVTRLRPEHIDKVLINILLTIRPGFEKESGAARTVAFNLFGHLAKFGHTEAFAEQIQNNIISLLLHLNDQLDDVKSACAYALQEVSPQLPLQHASLSEAVAKYVGKSGIVTDYNDFLALVCKSLTTTYPDMINFYALTCSKYFNSQNVRLKCNSAIFIGKLLGSLTRSTAPSISREQIFTGLGLLLKEPDASVRQYAAEAAASLYTV